MEDASKKIETDPSSILAQVHFELEKRYGQAAMILLNRLEMCHKGSTWIKSVRSYGDRTLKYVAQTAFYDQFTHKVYFSEGGNTLLHVGINGQITRWNWNEPASSSTSLPPASPANFRYGGLVSPTRFLLANNKEVWSLQVNNIWTDDLAVAVWKKIYLTDNVYRICCISTFPDTQIGLIACCSNDEAFLLHYSSERNKIEDKWDIPLPDPGNFINHLTVNKNGKSKAICFARGEILFSSGAQVFAHKGGAYHCQYVGDGSILASCGEDGSCALWDLQGRLLKRFELMYGSAECLAYCPKDLQLFIGHRSGFVSLLDLDFNNIDSTTIRSFVPGVHGWVLHLKISHCGNLLAVSGRNRLVRIFEKSEIISKPAETIQTLYFKPISITGISKNPYGCFFFDGHSRLSSTIGIRDSRYLPSHCNCGVIDTERMLIYAARNSHVHILKADTGAPLGTCEIDSIEPISMALSVSGKKLAILDKKKISILKISEVPRQLNVLSSIAIEEYFSSSEQRLPWPRNGLPMSFTQDGGAIILPIEKEVLLNSADKGNSCSIPQLRHKLAFFDICSRKLINSLEYEGFCTCIKNIPETSDLIIGLGVHNAFVEIDRTVKDYGKILIESPEPGLILNELKSKNRLLISSFPERDNGVTAVSACHDSNLLAVSFLSGRIALLNLEQRSWIHSISLDCPAMSVHFGTCPTQLLIADDGVATASKPVIHEFRLLNSKSSGLTQRS